MWRVLRLPAGDAWGESASGAFPRVLLCVLWTPLVHQQETSQRAQDLARDGAGVQCDIAQLADAPADRHCYNSFEVRPLPACVADPEVEAQTQPQSLMAEGHGRRARGRAGHALP